MSIKKTLEYIHSVKWQGSKPGLERTEELLKALGNPEKQLKFVHVAGTNGKGSTSVCIASILQKAGYRTGLYISPFILRFNERIQVNGVHITDDELELMIDEIRPFADVMTDSPTEFELITALAMKYFLFKDCDIVVLEVGLGGRMDSTNVIETPELAVITSIGYDHVKELGPTLSDIAREKAGIIKNGGDVLIYGGEREVTDVFECISVERGVKLYKVDFSRITCREFSLDGISFDLTPYGNIFVSLLGSYQPYNTTVAISAVEILRDKGYNISDNDIVSGVASVNWPGRFEVLGHKPIFILDGSHNVQGMEVTAESLRHHFGDKKIIFITGVMADKDVLAMMAHIIPFAKAFFAVKPEHERAMCSGELAILLADLVPLASKVRVIDCETVKNGVSKACAMAGENDIICAIGSLYFSAEIREAYLNH
ncbi:MAG: bifunctional folylpolyglutamate synthase/dihydrofolate synthase [Oscillospiraceae bacterium]|jgi:dihydrofolate synthase/folylpolyglutamate synthase|nr:bifunctional folylpolyglutamate synthase/dihydrofolate synthase [Oscillospiraceae bacterium]